MPLDFKGSPVTVIMKDGEPWWVAKEVCDILEIGNPREAVKRLDTDEKNTVRITDGKRGNPNRWIVNEPGLYSLIIRSHKPQAKAFKRWITHEVLPSIRKTGSYPNSPLYKLAHVWVECMPSYIYNERKSFQQQFSSFSSLFH